MLSGKAWAKTYWSAGKFGVSCLGILLLLAGMFCCALSSPARENPQPLPLKTPGIAPAAKDESPPGGKGAVTANSARRAGAKAHGTAPAKMLVPPPPPDVSLVPSPGRLSLLNGVAIDFLSKGDVEAMKGKVEKSLAKARKELSDFDASLSEKKERAEQFSSLYKEGVVSRRELESARKELSGEMDSLQESREKVAELQKDLSLLVVRLKNFEKRDQKPSSKVADTNRSRAGSR